MDRIHENIRRIRMRLGYSQEEMAEKMGVARTTYSNFELAKTNLLCDNFYLFAEVAGVTEEEILYGGPERSLGILNEGALEDRICTLEAKIDDQTRYIKSLEEKIDRLTKRK